MNVFITSSPYLDGANRALLNPENEFIDQLRNALPSEPRALFVASNPDAHERTCRFAADTAAAFSEAGMSFSSFQVLDGYNAEDAADLVCSSDLIVFAGGHVPTQNDFLNTVGMQVLLEDYEGTVMGISAGSMNLADMVYIQPEEDGESMDPDFVRFAPGLGLTDINLLPHYQKVKHSMLDGKRLFEDITYADSIGHTFFALPDGSYFYQNDDALLLFGEAYVLRDGVLEFINGSGDCLNMNDFE